MLPPNVWEHPESPEPVLRPVHAHFITKHIYDVLERGGYPDPHHWLTLCLTGSLCTFQYSPSSDADVSLFVDSRNLPEWSRAEMIGLMIEGCDGVTLPGTTYELQAYVVGKKLKPADLYKPGLRAGYDISTHRWISPPDPHAIHDVEAQENGFYVWALQQADKMERLLRYEPDKAQQFYQQLHRKRIRDQIMGKGDASESNIIYKFLDKRGLLPDAKQEFIKYHPDYAKAFPKRGHHRPHPARVGSTIADLAFQSILHNGGVTINLQGQEPTTGFAFAPEKATEEIVPLAQLTPQHIDQYIANHAQEMAAPGRYFGAWVSDNQAYLDVSHVETDFQRAHTLARGADQLAMWDIDNAQEVPLHTGVFS